jgi:hypothetical protein
VRRAIFFLALLACVGPVAAASAQRVLVLDGHRVLVRNEPLGPFADLPPGPAPNAAGHGARIAKLSPTPGAHAASANLGGVVLRALRHLLSVHAISTATFSGDWNTVRAARASYSNLSGTRRTELGAVLAISDGIASRGDLTAPRLVPVMLTIARNRQWWTTGPLLGADDRVSFTGSQIIYQYYEGEGLQLQMLGNWGKVNGLWNGHSYAQMRSFIDELIPLGVNRGGALAWEYYFPFDGGEPPWTSGLSQGSAVQALARAGLQFSDGAFVTLMHRAALVFDMNAPVGVRQPTVRGNHYLIYSFANGYHVINAFIGSLDALYDAAYITGDPMIKRLFHLGDVEARYELPYYDTGSWARYSNEGETSTDSYMGLLRDFLVGLCARTKTQEYCTYGKRFTTYIVNALGHDLPAEETPYSAPQLHPIPGVPTTDSNGTVGGSGAGGAAAPR